MWPGVAGCGRVWSGVAGSRGFSWVQLGSSGFSWVQLGSGWVLALGEAYFTGERCCATVRLECARAQCGEVITVASF